MTFVPASARTPDGAAGGVLGGTYPDPTYAAALGFFGGAGVAQQTLPAADPVLLADIIALGEAIRALLVAYGLATLV